MAPELPTIPLWEFEISGHLLVEGDPVAGAVGFQPVGAGTTRRFPTDDDLTYHLFYFGTLPFRVRHDDFRGEVEGLGGRGIDVGPLIVWAGLVFRWNGAKEELGRPSRRALRVGVARE